MTYANLADAEAALRAVRAENERLRKALEGVVTFINGANEAGWLGRAVDAERIARAALKDAAP